MLKLFKKSNRKPFTVPTVTAIKSEDVFDYVCTNFEDDCNVGISDKGHELLMTYASYTTNTPKEIEWYFCDVTPSEYATNFA